MKQQDKILVIIGTVAVLGVAGATGYTLFAAKETDTTKQSSTSQSVSSEDTSNSTSGQSSNSSSANQSYKDGEYSETISYAVPEGSDNSLEVTLKIENGIISDVKTETNYSDQESEQYVDGFNSQISGEIKGKSLAGLSISRVGGASLTSSAFNDVLDTIRDDAKV